MIIKIAKIFFSIFKIFIVIVIIMKLADLMSDYTPFVYGLKIKSVQKINYQENSNPNILPSNSNSVAIYSLHKDTSSLEEIFKIAGIPYFLCTDLKEANQTKILFLDFDINKNTTLEKDQIDFLHSFVSKGGIVVGNEVESVNFGSLKELFGYRKTISSQNHKIFKLDDSLYFKYLDTTEEKNYTLSTLKIAPYTNSIIKSTSKEVASYEDGSSAITVNKYGNGKAVMFGISLFDLRYRNLMGKDFNANTKRFNDFEPLSDMIILFLKGLYEAEVGRSITLATAPNEYKSSLVITHDIDCVDSMSNIKKFVDLETRLGIKSTFFVQTKYLEDDKDKAFFNQDDLYFIKDASNKGFDIGSLGVTQIGNFLKLKEGNYSENYPVYNPFVFNFKTSINRPTVSGELKVSKELLLGAGIGNITSFRSGNLNYNVKLPIAMEALGYKYGSCFFSEDILSYFPYRYKKDYARLENQSFIWEIPLSLEDEELPPLYFRLGKALAFFDKIHNNGGVFTLSIHPDLNIRRLKYLDIFFEESFIKKLPKDVWISTIKDIGDFWDKRDRVIFRYNLVGNMLLLNLYSPTDINGLGFDLHNIKLDIMQSKDIKISRNKIILNVKKGFNSWSLKILS